MIIYYFKIYLGYVALFHPKQICKAIIKLDQ